MSALVLPTILVSTWSDGLVAVSGAGRTHEFADQPVRGLAPDGRGGALAVVGGHELRRREPDGAWSTLATSPLELSCCMAVGDVIYVGTDDARLLRLSRRGGSLEALAGFDSVAGRETWFAGSFIVDGQRMGPPLGVRSLAANADASVLFANVHVGGIPRSEDGGKTWQPTLDINSDVHEVRAHPSDPSLVVAASAVGLWISRDSGRTWAVETKGLHASYCSAVAFLGTNILVSTSTDFFTRQGRIYRRPIAPDGIMVPVDGGLPPWLDGIADTGCVSVAGTQGAVIDRGGNLYLSPGLGMPWFLIGARLPTPSSILIC